MYKNKILYRPRTADPSTLTTDNLLTLANIITTSGLDHHCPPSLGVFTSVQVTMLYLQILTDQAGEIFYISEPLPGSTHDVTAIRNTGLFSYMQPWHMTADKGYVGLGCDTPFKRRPGKPLLGWQKRFNKGINAIRYVIERSIAHLKV